MDVPFGEGAAPEELTPGAKAAKLLQQVWLHLSFRPSSHQTLELISSPRDLEFRSANNLISKFFLCLYRDIKNFLMIPFHTRVLDGVHLAYVLSSSSYELY